MIYKRDGKRGGELSRRVSPGVSFCSFGGEGMRGRIKGLRASSTDKNVVKVIQDCAA